MTKRKSFSRGFTLAELLITLGIIGVVSAMTIPNLMTSIKAHKLRSQFLKSYSTVQQAFKQMEADGISLNPGDYGYSEFYKTFMKYFKVGVDCGVLTIGGVKNKPCLYLGESYKTLNNNTTTLEFFDNGQFVLLDGTTVLIENWKFPKIFISVDINGFNNKPNRWGYDLFTFEFLDGELRTMGDIKTTYNDMNKYCNTKSNDSVNGIACAQKAKENPDYFKFIVKNIK